MMMGRAICLLLSNPSIQVFPSLSLSLLSLTHFTCVLWLRAFNLSLTLDSPAFISSSSFSRRHTWAELSWHSESMDAKSSVKISGISSYSRSPLLDSLFYPEFLLLRFILHRGSWSIPSASWLLNRWVRSQSKQLSGANHFQWAQAV